MRSLQSNKTERSSNLGTIEDTLQREKGLSYNRRYSLRTQLKRYSTRGIIGCGIVGADQLIELKAYKNRSQVKVGRMNPCRRIYCPICSQHTAVEKATLAQRRIEKWIEQNEGKRVSFLFFTGTLGHSIRDNLKEQNRAISSVFSKTFRDTKRKVERVGGQLEYVRVLDYTYSVKNAHNPHFHTIVLLKDLNQKQLEEIKMYLRQKWITHSRRTGYNISEKHGCDIAEVENKSLEVLSRYLAKGSQMVREVVKTSILQDRYSWTGSLTFEAIWEKVVGGSPYWKRVWNQIEEGFHGVKIFQVSQGLADLSINEEIEDEDQMKETIELINGGVHRELENKGLMAPLMRLYERAIDGEHLDLYRMVSCQIRAARMYYRNKAEKCYARSLASLVSTLNLFLGRE